LSAADSNKVDQIASFIGSFSPISFTSLVYQLEALAAATSQATAQQSIASTAVNARASTTQGQQRAAPGMRQRQQLEAPPATSPHRKGSSFN